MHKHTPFKEHKFLFQKIIFIVQSSFILSLFIFSFSQAQIVFSTIQGDSSQLQTDFTKQTNTWNWRFKLLSVENFAADYYWDINESFNSNLITPKTSENRWKDEYKSKRLVYWTSNQQKLGLYTDSWILTDKRSAKKSEYSTNAAGFFSDYNFEQFFSVTPYIGYQKAKNVSISDWGWDAGIEGAVSGFKLGEYNSSLRGSTDFDVFENRQNYINKVAASIATDFTPLTRDSIKFNYEESSKEFYDLSDSTGTKLTKVDYFNRNLKNLLFYNISPNKMLVMQTNIESRNITYLTTRKIFLIGSQFSFQHFGPILNYKIDFKTSDETQDNENIRTDSRSRQSSLGIKSFYNIDTNKYLKFDVLFSKLQYDTPDDSVNNDDRDEQRFIFDFEYYHKLSPVLALSVNAYGFLFHQIYISKEQSQNNNWNRVIQLRPEVSYKNNGISNRLSTTVTANYTEYDFDRLFLDKRSFLSRKYTFADSLMISVLAYFKVGFFGKIEIEEKGSFFAKRFSQNLIRSLTSKRINTFVTKRLFQKVNLKIGYNYFIREEWQHIPKKLKVRKLVNNGPFINFGYEVERRISISASLSVNYFDDSSVSKASFINSHLKLFYYL